MIDDHTGAIQADLLIYAGKTLEDLGGSLSWGAFKSFLSHLPPESATVGEINPELHKWGSGIKTNAILADIYDMLAQINSNLVAIGERKPARKFKPYPRPNQKTPEDEKKIGYGALPVADLEKWFEQKRKEHYG